MGIREGLLTLLARAPAPGYQLKLDLENATGEAWPLNVGQVYTTLQRLERDGLVESVEPDLDGRVVYELTSAGRDEMDGWLQTPIERTVANRDDVSMKLLLAMASDVVDPVVVVSIQRNATMSAIQDYTRLKRETPPDDVAWLLHVDRLILRAEAELRWLARVEERIARVSGVDRAHPAHQEERTVDTVQSGGQE
jgi:DNA-binding PadR family transcriptional regulator